MKNLKEIFKKKIKTKKEIKSTALSNNAGVQNNKDLSKEYTMTVDEFWNKDRGKVGVYCMQQWEAEILTKVFDRMGKEWPVGGTYLYNCWSENLSNVYLNNGYMDNIRTVPVGYGVILLKDLDLTKYLTEQEIKDLERKTRKLYTANVCPGNHVFNTGKSFDKSISVNEFWCDDKYLSIHCDEEWKAEILTKVFDKMGKKWYHGGSYSKEINWNAFKSETVYTNNGFYDDKPTSIENGYHVYQFEDVDLSKYLNVEEKIDVKNKLLKSNSKNVKNDFSL